MNVPGINLPNIPRAPVNSQNFSIGVLPYSLEDVTATFAIFVLPINLAATSILAKVLLISRIYNPSGLARVIKDDINLVFIGVPTLIPVDNIIFSKLLGSSIESEFSVSELGKFDDDDSIESDENHLLSEMGYLRISFHFQFHHMLNFHTH